MKEKNRFSNLLEYLMDTCDIKNLTLAKDLQYDVSYISKWVSGRMLPSSKNEKAVLQGISHCIVSKGSDEGRLKLQADYQTTSYDDLELAVFYNLMAEYNYVREAERNTGNSVAPKTVFYPKLDMQQYIDKMHHPVLHRVNSLEIVAAMDILSMEQEYRLQLLNINVPINTPGLPGGWHYPDVHFSLIINLKHLNWNYLHDIVFLINMMVDMSHVDFHLYGSDQAHGRAMFAVKEDFAISGMLIDRNQCLSVTVSEDPDNCEMLHRYLQTLCSKDHLLIRRLTMSEMMYEISYARSLLSPNQQLLIGHFTEHFLTEALFDEIIAAITEDQELPIPVEKLRWYHNMQQQCLEKLPMKVVFYKAALSEFALTGQIDFFGRTVTLSPKQRLVFINHIRDLIMQNSNITPKLIYGRLISNFHYSHKFAVFVSDALTCLRLENQECIHLINHSDLKDAFQQFYTQVWNTESSNMISNHADIINYFDHIVQQIQIIENLDN